MIDLNELNSCDSFFAQPDSALTSYMQQIHDCMKPKQHELWDDLKSNECESILKTLLYLKEKYINDVVVLSDLDVLINEVWSIDDAIYENKMGEDL